MAVRVGIITISDRCSKGEAEDTSGKTIAEMTNKIGAASAYYRVIPDERELISSELRKVCDEDIVDVLFTTGGTGLGPRDVTPEATGDVIEKEIPGIAEAMRQAYSGKNPRAMLSRAMAGVRKKTIIVNLPGSPRGVRESLDIILEVIPHAVDIVKCLPTDH
jgi:molybdenum cofactor synthesis domain-containing protein